MTTIMDNDTQYTIAELKQICCIEFFASKSEVPTNHSLPLSNDNPPLIDNMCAIEDEEQANITPMHKTGSRQY
jgi:hypothetical protein